MRYQLSIFLTAIIVCLLLLQPIAYTAPYITPAEWEKIQSAPVLHLPLPTVDDYQIQQRLLELTDEGYAYLAEYIQICEFLALWQYSDTSSINYGGMIEGESGDLLNIIQTDNTQEAIRVWGRYARLTGDLQYFQENIAAAWEYTRNFPAYSEEGETDYYRVHNCGWGLVAQMEYLEIYGDSSFCQYADSCADFMMTHPLSFTQGLPFYQQLHPLVTGWAAGTLYQYGQFTGNQTYIDTSLIFGERVKEWIEADPNRLNNNELWAMSGGTAMWGVIESVFQDDSLAGVAWLQQYLPYMDVYAGPGEWNNSWNIWYSHAHRAAYDVLGDSLYQYYAVFLVDTLLSQDTDNDGGIPAGSADPDTMDQTWVSCYTDYMGIEKIISNLPQLDAGVICFVQPQSGIPVQFPADIAISLLAANYGSEILDEVTVNALISPDYSGSGTAYLTVSAMDTVGISPAWIPPDTGFYSITAYTSLTGDMNPANDTASIIVEIRGAGTLTGIVTNGQSGQGLECLLLFYHQEVSDEEPFAQIYSQLPSGEYSLDLMAGEYRIEVFPQIPYNIIDFFPVQVSAGQVNQFDMTLYPAPLLLVDDDESAWYEEYYITHLVELGVEHYLWEYSSQGALDGNAVLFPMCIWFTGKDSTATLLPEDKDELSAFLQNGGNLILSGQNIGDDLGFADPFLNDYLKVEHESDNVNQYLLDGVEGNSISQGTSLFLIGSGGAGNQTSPSSCIPLPGAQTVYIYQNPPHPIGAILYESPEYDYKSIYFSFGIEGISGLMNTNDLQGLLYNIFQWWQYPTETAYSENSAVPEFQLFPPFPNPCNPAAKVTYHIPQAGYTELGIYNILGQQVALIWSGQQLPGTHAFIFNGQGFSLPSGVYYCRLISGSNCQVQPLIILK